MLTEAPIITLMCTIHRDCAFFLETLIYIATPFLVVATLALIIAGIAYLVNRNYEQSFAKEMQDYIEQPIKCMDKATNAEDMKELEQKDPVVGDYGKKPSAPPYDGPKQPGLYPDLSEAQPPSYEEACSTVQPKDSQPGSNLDSVLPPSNNKNWYEQAM